MARMNWDRVHRERNLHRRRHFSDDPDIIYSIPRQRPPHHSATRCTRCTLVHPGEC